MDLGRKVPEDGTLPWVTGNTPNNTNIMIIKVPDHLRKQGDPMFELATVNRDIPGADLDGNRILDALYPGLKKVTLFEEPKQKDATPSPKKIVPKREYIKPCRSSSNAFGKSRSYYHKKPSPETRIRKKADEICPWLPGEEPYNPLRAIPMIRKVGSGFDDDPPPSYSGGFGKGSLPPPTYQNSSGLLPNLQYNNPVRRSFISRIPNSGGGRPANNPRDDPNPNQRFQRGKNFRNNNYSIRGHSRAERSTFEDRSSVAQSWTRNEMPGPSTRNTDRGGDYATNKRRAAYRRPYNRRGRQNYRNN